MTGVTLPSSINSVSVIRFRLFAVHRTTSTMAIRWDTSGDTASTENT